MNLFLNLLGKVSSSLHKEIDFIAPSLPIQVDQAVDAYTMRAPPRLLRSENLVTLIYCTIGEFEGW